MTTAHDALIYTMILVSGSDRVMTDAELRRIGDLTAHLPAFKRFDRKRLVATARRCAALLQREDGLRRALHAVRTGVPKRQAETAYALAWEIALVDGGSRREENRMIELIRGALKLDGLVAAAIERGVRARFAA
jgi:tellurite resistance protein